MDAYVLNKQYLLEPIWSEKSLHCQYFSVTCQGIDIPINLLMRYLWEMKSSDGFNLGAVFLELHSCFTAVHLPTIAQIPK